MYSIASGIASILCVRMGRSVGTTRNSTESGRSQVWSQVAVGVKFSSVEKSHSAH